MWQKTREQCFAIHQAIKNNPGIPHVYAIGEAVGLDPDIVRRRIRDIRGGELGLTSVAYSPETGWVCMDKAKHAPAFEHLDYAHNAVLTGVNLARLHNVDLLGAQTGQRWSAARALALTRYQAQLGLFSEQDLAKYEEKLADLVG